MRAFYDSNGDGIGDFRGLTEKLPYLTGLGVTAIWLLPFYPSPLKDEGYDVADYKGIHPSYGTIADFEEFLATAHRLGLRVITELVLNHTSDQHLWFQRSRNARPGTEWRDFYLWSDTPDRFKGVRVIFNDFEKSNWTWDPVAGAYYWHRFFSHQPDLNLNTPAVQKALLDVVDFWLNLGVDGMRLDAVPYLFEREGTACENLPETHQFLKKLRSHVDSKFSGRMLLAEADQPLADATAYFGSGDECNMAFHFPLTLSLFEAIAGESSSSVTDTLERTPEIPKGCQWAIFLRNHDMLSLEMVTPENRELMLEVYGSDRRSRLNQGIRRRLAPLMGNERDKIELMNVLLFTLPGAPVLYYGDEIGMGDDCRLPDRSGVRTPMQWSPNLNAGFSSTNPPNLYLPLISDSRYGPVAVNVENQWDDASSLLEWTRRLIAIASHSSALRRGQLLILKQPNSQILSFIRHSRNEHVLVVANLSSRSQNVELGLEGYKGWVRTRLSSGDPIDGPIGRTLKLALGPHGYTISSLVLNAGPRSHVTPGVGSKPKASSFRGRTNPSGERGHKR